MGLDDALRSVWLVLSIYYSPFLFFFVSYIFRLLVDTIYACQDRRDDVKVGVKSAAILLGDYAGPVCFALSMMFVSMLAYAGVLNGQSPYYFVISVGGTAAHIIYQYVLVDLQVPTSCGRKYSIQCFMDCSLCRFIFGLATDGDCLNHRILRHERTHGHHHLVGYVGRLPRQDRCHSSPQTLDTLKYRGVSWSRLSLVPSALPPAGLPRKSLSTVCTF